jgi:predicted nucleic acid-binding protein
MYVVGKVGTTTQQLSKKISVATQKIQKVIAGQTLNIHHSANEKSVITVYDLSGHLVKKTTMNNGNISTKLLGIVEGTYIVKTHTEKLVDR